jgi:hypothetical protein
MINTRDIMISFFISKKQVDLGQAVKNNLCFLKQLKKGNGKGKLWIIF